MDFDAMMGDDSWLQDSPPRLSEPVSKAFKKRAKAMNIDELLKDHHKDKSKELDRDSKRLRTFVSDSEDSEEENHALKTPREVKFEGILGRCEKQIHADGATKDIPKWGERLFSGQSHREPSVPLSLESPLVQALLVSKEQFTYNSSESEKDDETTEALVAELLASGWFLSFKFKLDREMMYWILDTMIFTTNKELEKAACEFLCHTLESENCNFSWIPSYSAILKTFEAYGYIGDEVANHQSKDALDSKVNPLHNLGSLLRFLTACLRKRRDNTEAEDSDICPLSAYHVGHIIQLEGKSATKAFAPVYPREDVENLAVLIASLSLDRRLLGLGVLIQECLSAVLKSFTEDEWHISCESIAVSIAKVNRQMVNSLKLTRTLLSQEARMKRLQSLIALQLFAKISNEKAVSGIWDIMAVFRRINLKRSEVDFPNLFYQISMADIWLWSSPALKSQKGAVEAWQLFLKACSFQISSTDTKPYATKVRNHASHLLQVYQCYYQSDEYEET